ncbi:TPA: DEAD/DEAH box helicase [Salmonella enterica]|uniref:Putative DNA helicase n=2 Tax=Lokivirus IMEAB3 TaxID=2560266 RepID=A0A481S294_9CAUD|nr:putative DNA/RNA helicase protein [Acinetobacter phage IMEAB3]AHI60016.1 putative DNA/RNA helicase protein [Acinetobacter phage IMEAB3]QBG78731.1 putative DNA helicase [Acinetobacter phage vB_AbaS_D0]HCH9143025.1 DEAD/DEAH box helicase [Salmonella enterica]
MQLRFYQRESIDAIYNYFNAGNKGNPVIALQTGLGKSVVLGGAVCEIMYQYPSQRLIMATHVKELVEQNAKKLTKMWASAPIGIYSAGLKQKDAHAPIVYGSIQSMANNPAAFGHRDLMFVDECQLVGDKANSQYISFIGGLAEINPHIKIIGLSATPYRMKMGMITEGGIFTDVIYDTTNLEGWTRMIAEGFLCPPVSKVTDEWLSAEGVRKVDGDFNIKQLQDAVDTSEKTFKCCVESIEKCYDRHSILVFATGIEHAEHVAETLNALGQNAAYVHSKMKGADRDRVIEDFKQGKIRWLVNNGILTTGFDHPPLDAIIMLRPTLSVGLWVQMVGRGTRPYDFRMLDQYVKGFEYVKQNCLILDFARNTDRLGAVNQPVPPRKKGESTGDAPVKICPNPACKMYNHASARYCGGEPFPTFSGCGYEFIYDPNDRLYHHASEKPILVSDLPELEMMKVTKVLYSVHNKENMPPSMKVTYICGVKSFTEYICLQHSGMAQRKAFAWWTQRTGYTGDQMPTTAQAVNYSSHLPIPNRIKVWTNKKYPEIMSYEF